MVSVKFRFYFQMWLLGAVEKDISILLYCDEDN